MSTGLLFVTAPNADFKAINRFLLHIRDWEYGDASSWDSFHLLISKSDPDFEMFKDSRRHQLPSTTPGDIPAESFTNEWAGASIQDIESYVLSADNTGVDGNGISLFLILDDQGIRDKTCIVAEAYTEWDDDANPPRRIPKEDREQQYDFNKFRAPWSETHSVWANLNIANMDFGDFADEDEGADDEGWWTFQGVGEDLSEENRQKKEEALRRFEEEGKI